MPLRSTGWPTAGADEVGVDDTLFDAGGGAAVFDVLQPVAAIKPITATAASRRTDLPVFMIPPSWVLFTEIMFVIAHAVWMKER